MEYILILCIRDNDECKSPLSRVSVREYQKCIYCWQVLLII